MSKPDKLIEAAAKKAGVPPDVVEPVVGIVLNRSARGQSAAEISSWLKSNNGPGDPAAQLGFVRWLIAEHACERTV